MRIREIDIFPPRSVPLPFRAVCLPPIIFICCRYSLTSLRVCPFYLNAILTPLHDFPSSTSTRLPKGRLTHSVSIIRVQYSDVLIHLHTKVQVMVIIASILPSHRLILDLDYLDCARSYRPEYSVLNL